MLSARGELNDPVPLTDGRYLRLTVRLYVAPPTEGSRLKVESYSYQYHMNWEGDHLVVRYEYLLTLPDPHPGAHVLACTHTCRGITPSTEATSSNTIGSAACSRCKARCESGNHLRLSLFRLFRLFPPSLEVVQNVLHMAYVLAHNIKRLPRFIIRASRNFMDDTVPAIMVSL